jgi:Family of unknown function (DUF5519)
MNQITVDALPQRSGSRPGTTPSNPHMQLDQQPESRAVREALARRVFALPGVRERPSMISVPGARALWLDEGEAGGPPEAFMVGREFAHLHPHPDQSLHMMLPLELVQRVVTAGWGEPHPVAAMGLIPRTAVMVYAPRDEAELGVVASLVEAAHRFARGG